MKPTKGLVEGEIKQMAEEDYEGDYRCDVSEDERCRKVATKVFREPFTPARVAVPCCDEHAEGLRASGYHFDEQATIELARDVEREAEQLAILAWDSQ